MDRTLAETVWHLIPFSHFLSLSRARVSRSNIIPALFAHGYRSTYALLFTAPAIFSLDYAGFGGAAGAMRRTAVVFNG